MRVQVSKSTFSSIALFCRPVRVIRLISEGTIEEGIYSIAQEKLKLEQDLSNADDEENGHHEKQRAAVSRLLKIALDVEFNEKQIGDVGKVYTEL